MRHSLAVVVAAAALAAGCGSSPPPESEEPRPFRGRYVLVNWLGQGRFFVARAVAEDQGLLRVRYADGTEEWAEGERIQEERITGGDHVTVLLRDSLPPWGGVVQRRRGDRILVLFDAGGTAWVDLGRVEAVGNAPEPLRLPEARRIVEPEEEEREPERPVLDPALLVPGATLTAVWAGRSFDAVLLERRGDLLKVRWDGDGTTGWIEIEYVQRLYPPPDRGQVEGNARVRARAPDGHAYDAVVVGRLRNKVRVRWVEDGTETEIGPSDILRVHTRVPLEALREGAIVRVGWLGDVFEAEVLERREELVRIKWQSDGGEAWVDAADVREVVTP